MFHKLYCDSYPAVKITLDTSMFDSLINVNHDDHSFFTRLCRVKRNYTRTNKNQ